MIVLSLSGWAIYGISEALKLEQPVEEEKWFPDGHMYNDFSTRESNLFLSKATDSYVYCFGKTVMSIFVSGKGQENVNEEEEHE